MESVSGNPIPRRIARYGRPLLVVALIIAILQSISCTSTDRSAADRDSRPKAEISPAWVSEDGRKYPYEIILPPSDMVMVLVPPGPFIMGSDEGRDDAQPVRTVWLSGYYVDKLEVSNGIYSRFVEETGRRVPIFQWLDEVNSPGFAVCGVSQFDSRAFALWAGKRLPTEAEWEKAARGEDGRQWPWGNEFDRGKGNFHWNDDPWEKVGPVGAFPEGASPYGALDMAGNVYEWCEDLYDPDYYKRSPDRDPPACTEGELAVMRGGDWVKGHKASRCWERYWRAAPGTSLGIGFRCVIDMDRAIGLLAAKPVE